MEFAFSLTIEAVPWDAYYFEKDGKPGTLAFCKDGQGQFVIGLFRAGRLPKNEVEKELRRGEHG